MRLIGTNIPLNIEVAGHCINRGVNRLLAAIIEHFAVMQRLRKPCNNEKSKIATARYIAADCRIFYFTYSQA